MLNANKLALENNVSRKVLSIRFDDKRNQWCVTHETSTGHKDMAGYRCDVDYYIFDLTPDFNINAALITIKSEATLAFLGLVEIGSEDDRQLTEAPKEIAETGKVEATEAAPAPAPDKPRRKRRTKAEIAAAKAAKEAEAEDENVEANKPTEVQLDPPAERPASTDEEDPLGMDGDEAPKAEPQLYQKNTTDHAVHLRDLIEDKFGAEWKKNKTAVTVVKGLVAKLHNTVAVLDGEGKVLKSFKQFVNGHLKAA